MMSGPPPSATGNDLVPPPLIVSDITEMNPVVVSEIIIPETVEELCQAIIGSDGHISVGGARCSMGGQIAIEGGLHIDMRRMNAIVDLDAAAMTITVQAGITWREIQEYIDPHDLSLEIMQTYANFTVGGSLGVNAHGRYMGRGPVVLAVRRIRLVLADGSLVTASRDENSELFAAAIGGYGSVGVIVEATLSLARNERVRRSSRRLKVADYLSWFRDNIRVNETAVFHNADIYPPHFRTVSAVTWSLTEEPATTATRLHPVNGRYPVQNYLMWAISETPFGKWRRQFLYEPLHLALNKVHWRNYEASYDIAELQPVAARNGTFVLQEYFVPVAAFDRFSGEMFRILRAHRVNVINISVRHAIKDSDTCLNWAREEMFALVLYYKQKTDACHRHKVGVWTRQLTEAVLECGGTYYLPYQPHATPDQFHRAYPGARSLFNLKTRIDPDGRFTNQMIKKYYNPQEPVDILAGDSEFLGIHASREWSDRLYEFLRVVFNLYPEDRFAGLISDACDELDSDEAIYRHVQSGLGSIKPFGHLFRHAIPTVRTQKRELTSQTLRLLGDRRSFDGYLEIGSTGFYISELSKHLDVTGPLRTTDFRPPAYGPADIVTRGRIGKIGTFFDLDRYNPIKPDEIADASLDLVTCYIGLHHCPPGKQEAYIRSIARILRPGGLFIFRDHDVRTPEMARFVSLIHTVFNAGTGESWETDTEELKHFDTADGWAGKIGNCGFRDLGGRLEQEGDPSKNILMAFERL